MNNPLNYRCAKVALTLLAGLTISANAVADDEYPQLTDVPTVYIDTENSVAVTSKEDYVKATLRYVDASGVTVYDGTNIRGRGNSTWGLAKKPYRIKFDKKQKFLGKERANAKSWTLLANYADKTLIRNAVAACIGDFAGQPFTAAAKFVDLVLNGTYLGNYQISDQMEVREKRVNITEQADSITDDSNITGGYFMEVDGFAESEDVYITTSKGVLITIKSPDEDVIDQRQIDYIREHINKFEAALFSSDFTDPEKGYRPYVDPETLASWYVASELTGNPDCFWSTYIYKEKDDDKIYWGPLWDYDIAFNNCNRVGDVSRALMLNKGFGDNLTKVWVKRMWQDPWFVQLIQDKWQQMVDDGIEQHIIDYIDSVAAEIEQSQQKNFTKWSINTRVYNEIVLFNTYAEGITYLKEFIHNHCAYLTEAFADAANESLPTAAFEPDSQYFYLIENYGSKLYVDYDNNDLVVMNSRRSDTSSQQWYFAPVADTNYFRIINNSNGKAITDAATATTNWGTTTYNTGAQLTLTDVDEDNTAQEWMFDPISTGNRYAVVNRKTNLAWNNSGGGTSDGTHAISWTNDSNNASKSTRQWRPVKDAARESSSLTTLPEGPDYMVTYSAEDATLHFRAADSAMFANGTVSVYNLAGSLMGTYPTATDVNLASLPTGLYVISWKIGNLTGSVKLTR
jgi:hypothetical protein